MLSNFEDSAPPLHMERGEETPIVEVMRGEVENTTHDYTLTVTRKNVAGIEVLFGSALLF